MEKENFFIGNRYEIHREQDYIIVKDAKQVSYLKITGHVKDAILHNTKDSETKVLLDRFFSKQNRAVSKKLICIKNRHQEKMLKFFSNYPDVLCRISSMIFIIMCGFFVGMLSIKYQAVSEQDSYIMAVPWVIINILVHEAGHIFFCEQSGRIVYSFGIKMNYGIPMFYVDTTDICMAGLSDRVKTSLGGVCFNSLICIVSGLFGLFYKHTCMLDCSRIAFFFMVSNLIPFWKLDGYYVLSDCFSVSNLHKESRKVFKRFSWKEKDSRSIFLTIYFISRQLFFLIIIFQFFVQVISYICTIF